MCSRAKLDQRERLLVAHRPERPPRIDARGEARLALPHVADARHGALVEQRLADRAPRVMRAQPRQEQRACRSPRPARPGRAPCRRGSVRVRASLHQLEQRAVELDDLPAAVAQHQPCTATRATPALALAVDVPRAGHAQVRVQRQAAVEAQEQVLAVRVDRAHSATGQPLGPAIELVARMRREDLLGHASLEHRANARCGVVDRVALGHAFTIAEARAGAGRVGRRHGARSLRSPSAWQPSPSHSPPVAPSACARCHRRDGARP